MHERINFNLKRAVKFCLLEKGVEMKWLIEFYNGNSGKAYSMVNASNPTLKSLNELADIFDMSLSEFILQGER